MTIVEQKQFELEAAWQALQNVPSYVEVQAAKFASEPGGYPDGESLYIEVCDMPAWDGVSDLCGCENEGYWQV